MKALTVIVFLFLSSLLTAQDGFPFDQYFENQTLRIDYFHTGDAKNEEITLDKMYIRGTWAGNPDNCLKANELGMYKVKVFDGETGKLLYFKGYNSIFAEYKTISDAMEGIRKTFHETVLIPLPRKPVRLVIEVRDRTNKLSPLYSTGIDPADYHINRENARYDTDIVIPAVNNGNPHEKVDIAVLAEGYRTEEIDLFKSDLEYYTKLFFSVEPYKSNAGDFNINGIFSPSGESGTDEPRQRIYRNTRLGSSFNYFDLDRYCLADDNRSIRDVASVVPYDAIIIMVNRERYGGGGIYNWQTVFSARADRSDYLLLHEFGHGFAGLADEYFDSPVSYVDLDAGGIEPLEANITILPDKNNVKWKKYLTPGIEIPTDWGKEKYDSLVALRRQAYEDGEKIISDLRKSGAGEEKLNSAREEIRAKVDRINQEIDDFYSGHPMKDKVGVFEGANYQSKGVYRPTIMSLMHGYKYDLSYDTVNTQAIIEVINYYTGK